MVPEGGCCGCDSGGAGGCWSDVVNFCRVVCARAAHARLFSHFRATTDHSLLRSVCLSV